MKRTQYGITIVALVITIIILLILAGITISSLTQTSLFAKSNEAKEKTEIAQEKEKIQLVITNCFIMDNNYIDGIYYDTFVSEFNREYPNEANISKCTSRPNNSVFISLIKKLIFPEVYATDNNDEVAYALVRYNSGREYYVCLVKHNNDNVGNIFIEEDTKRDKYTITYALSEEIDNVSSMPIDTNVYYEGDEITILSTEPVREDYEFLGWTTDRSSSIVEYVSGDKITVESNNIVLYAIWNKTEHGRLVNISNINDFSKKVNYKVVINKGENEKITLDNWNYWYNDGSNIWIILDGFLPNELIPERLNTNNENIFIKSSTYFINWKKGTTCQEAHESLTSADNWTLFASGVQNVNGENALAYGTRMNGWSPFDMTLTDAKKDTFNPVRNDCRLHWDYANEIYTSFIFSGVNNDGDTISSSMDWDDIVDTTVDAGLRITVKLPSDITGTVGNSIKIDNQFLTETE